MILRYLSIFIIATIVCSTAFIAGGTRDTSCNVTSDNFTSGNISGSFTYILTDIVRNGTGALINTNNIDNNSNGTIIYDKTNTLKYPTKDQLVTFLTNDNTDVLGLSDDEATTRLATNAVANGYHIQILMIQFKSGQVFSINRFILSDGAFAYVDCSMLNGVNTVTSVTSLDRFLKVKSDQPITAISIINQNITFTYPDSKVDYETPIWSV